MTALKSLTYKDEDAVKISAFPNALNLFSWNGMVETPDFLELLPVDSGGGAVDPHNLAVMRYKPQETPVTLAAERSQLGRVFLDWAQYPLVEEQRLTGNRYLVTFLDLRFSTARSLRLRVASPLAGYVTIDSQLRVEKQVMGGPQPD
jgi:inner membrane protein